MKKSAIKKNKNYFFIRFFAFLIDCIILSPFIWISNFFISDTIMTIPIMVIYYIFCYVFIFRSLGQKIVGLQIVNYQNMSHSHPRHFILRAILKPILMLFLCLPLLPVFLNKRSLLDLLCNTIVISDV